MQWNGLPFQQQEGAAQCETFSTSLSRKAPSVHDRNVEYGIHDYENECLYDIKASGELQIKTRHLI